MSFPEHLPFKYKTEASRGFTLIEVMIALTLLSLILVLLFSTVFSANRSWLSTERKISKNDEIRLVSQFIQKQISQNVPLVWVDQRKQNLLFNGKTNELNFTSSLPAHRGGGGIQLISLKVIRDDDARNLSLYFQQTDIEGKPFEDLDEAEHLVLINDIEDIELSYFGRDKIDSSLEWKDEWKNNEFLPELISLKVYSDNDQHWPEIRIPIHVDYIRGQPQFILNKSNNNSI